MLDLTGVDEDTLIDSFYLLTNESCSIETLICSKSSHLNVLNGLSLKEAIQNNISLVYLDISSNRQMGDKTLKGIIKQICLHPKLSSVNLSDTNVPKDSSALVKKMIMTNKNIKTLDLSSNLNIDDSFAQEIFNAKSTSLVTLNLASCSINDDSISFVEEFIRNNKFIEVINLSENKISEKGTKKLLNLKANGVSVNISNQKKNTWFGSFFS